MSSETDQSIATPGRSAWNLPLAFGAVLSVFSFFAVNYWVYTARWWFRDIMPNYPDPPTISRAIVEAEIRAPFLIWISVSAIFLAISVFLLLHHYRRVWVGFDGVSRPVWLGVNVVLPMCCALQLLSGWGMYTLSANSLFSSNAMHMMGSYVFFASQAAVVLLYAIWNHILLHERVALAWADQRRRLSARWVFWRCVAGYFAAAMALLYFGLFKAKEGLSFAEAPVLYWTYVSTEPAVITCFLAVVVMAYGDKLRRAVAV